MHRKSTTNAAKEIWFRTLVSAVAAALLGSCASLGGSDFPVFRSLGWFRYLDGADIRESCAAGTPDRYRLVYNAIWGRQVRIYEVTSAAPRPDGSVGPSLTTRVLFPENFNGIDLTDPLSLYRGNKASAALSRSDLAELRHLLAESDFGGTPPVGVTLPSEGFYWVVAACEAGNFHYNAYLYPSPRFAEIRFAAWLFARDGSQVAVAAPGPSPARPYNRSQLDDAAYSSFDLVVGENGLRGLP